MRVVIDTNVLISALLFKGELSQIHKLWKNKRIVSLVTREIFDEFLRVLKYPKFQLSDDDIQYIIQEEILPYFEVIEIIDDLKGISKDPDDDKFISCAVNGKAEFIISGDKHLLEISGYQEILIISPNEFLKLIKTI